MRLVNRPRECAGAGLSESLCDLPGGSVYSQLLREHTSATPGHYPHDARRTSTITCSPSKLYHPRTSRLHRGRLIPPRITQRLIIRVKPLRPPVCRRSKNSMQQRDDADRNNSSDRITQQAPRHAILRLTTVLITGNSAATAIIAVISTANHPHYISHEA